ncbi:hypothetical protein RIR_jg15405.t1 [Rhizophagus irregularis DAOM 181602=DAOM 197198]|nr:hypothetical protein RIR_jg15405.t1 [Rhizophagus irregularis DAOM 181602=DAOM 197198]
MQGALIIVILALLKKNFFFLHVISFVICSCDTDESKQFMIKNGNAELFGRTSWACNSGFWETWILNLRNGKFTSRNISVN